MHSNHALSISSTTVFTSNDCSEIKVQSDFFNIRAIRFCAPMTTMWPAIKFMVLIIAPNAAAAPNVAAAPNIDTKESDAANATNTVVWRIPFELILATSKIKYAGQYVFVQLNPRTFVKSSKYLPRQDKILFNLEASCEISYSVVINEKFYRIGHPKLTNARKYIINNYVSISFMNMANVLFDNIAINFISGVFLLVPDLDSVRVFLCQYVLFDRSECIEGYIGELLTNPINGAKIIYAPYEPDKQWDTKRIYAAPIPVLKRPASYWRKSLIIGFDEEKSGQAILLAHEYLNYEHGRLTRAFS
jgi:hypothetical protein